VYDRTDGDDINSVMLVAARVRTSCGRLAAFIQATKNMIGVPDIVTVTPRACLLT
jgi:hypothetical protein